MSSPIIDTLDRIPPFLCLALAKQLNDMSVDSIAEMANCHRRTVSRLAGMVSWADVKLSVIIQVASACKVDLMNPEDTLARFRSLPPEKRWTRLSLPQYERVLDKFRELSESR
jgi:hypothetical protein